MIDNKIVNNGQTRQRITMAVLGIKMDNLREDVRDIKVTLKDHCEADEEWRGVHNREISLMKSEIAVLKVKAGAWGMAGGAIPLIIMIAIDLLKG